MVHLGIIGAGAIAAEHVAAFGRLGCEICIVTAPHAASAAGFARRHGIARWTSNVTEVVNAGDIDAVVVASPSSMHADQTLAALKGGKHVLCEIPLAMSLAEAERIVETAHSMGLLCMVCHTQRFWGPVQHLGRLVAGGSIQPLHLGVVRAMYRRENVGWTGRKRTWVDDVLWHHGAHAIDTAAYLLGETIARVVGHAGPRHTKTGKPLDVSLSVATTRGRIGTIMLSYNSHVSLNEIVLIGVEDTFRFRAGELRSSHGEVLLRGTDAELQELAMDSQNRQFIDGITRGTPMDTTAEGVIPIYAALRTAASHLADETGA
jgi:2-hydroxy-4-carboxymuconate semialdehyde hemiacetal dehydrogenase